MDYVRGVLTSFMDRGSTGKAPMDEGEGATKPSVEAFMLTAIAKAEAIPAERRETLDGLVAAIIALQASADNGEVPIIFVCTHNSRRSIFCQVWGQVAAEYYGVRIASFSGGIEVTEANGNVLNALATSGLAVESEVAAANPVHTVTWELKGKTGSLDLFSKLYDDERNPRKGFIAVMTCDHANEACPFVSGCAKRIPVMYVDPKKSDGSGEEAAVYGATSLTIASELAYVMRAVSQSA